VERLTPTMVCNGCKYLITTVNGMPHQGLDRWGCGEPSTYGQTNPPTVDSRSIGYGTGSCPTPIWCPFMKGG
jgi:hypothetical protein